MEMHSKLKDMYFFYNKMLVVIRANLRYSLYLLVWLILNLLKGESFYFTLFHVNETTPPSLSVILADSQKLKVDMPTRVIKTPKSLTHARLRLDNHHLILFILSTLFALHFYYFICTNITILLTNSIRLPHQHDWLEAVCK